MILRARRPAGLRLPCPVSRELNTGGLPPAWPRERGARRVLTGLLCFDASAMNERQSLEHELRERSNRDLQ